LITELLIIWGGLFTKLSVLLFYRRIVAGAATMKFKIPIWVGMAFVTLYSIAFTALVTTQCSPVNGYWNRYVPEWYAVHGSTLKCATPRYTYIISSVIGSVSVFTDWYCVMLPAVLLLGMTMNTRDKYGLICIFALGYA
jgi:hypothetical protein